MIFFLIGFMGSGKTSYGRQWAEQEGLKFIDLDEQIEVSEGMSVNRIFASKGEAYFRTVETRELRSIDLTKPTIVACGGGTACNTDNFSWMNKNGATIYLNVDEQELLRRLAKEKLQRPILTSLSGEALEAFIHDELQARKVFYRQAKIHLLLALADESTIRKIFTFSYHA